MKHLIYVFFSGLYLVFLYTNKSIDRFPSCSKVRELCHHDRNKETLRSRHGPVPVTKLESLPREVPTFYENRQGRRVQVFGSTQRLVSCKRKELRESISESSGEKTIGVFLREVKVRVLNVIRYMDSGHRSSYSESLTESRPSNYISGTVHRTLNGLCKLG